MVAGNEGLFNLGLEGSGVVALESPVPASELVVVDLDGDELKVDGNFAIAWTEALSFTVERSGKSLVGSAVSGEGLVNVYRGRGRVLLSPVGRSRPTPTRAAARSRGGLRAVQAAPSASAGNTLQNGRAPALRRDPPEVARSSRPG